VFAPATELSRCGLTVLRPFVYAEQKDIIALANGLPLPVVKSPCPACGETARAKTEDIITALESHIPDVRIRLKTALEGTENYKLWKKESNNDN
jgi:tRNA(Ile)-lysidine synthase TilS/MesJ